MDQTTEKFASYASNLTYADLTPQAIHAAQRCLIDALGCALGAFHAQPVQAVRRLASQVNATHPASLIGTSLKSTVDWAGFVNGTMIRHADFSDDYFGGSGRQAGPHPSDNLGSVLAVTESAGADGRTLILATVLAYEACGQLVDLLLLHPQGWDYPVMHSVATALAAGKVLGLTHEQLGNALGLAVVPNICLLQARLGELSNWKGMAGPNGSRNGLFAAQLAKEGITGPVESFEGKAGFMRQLKSTFELPAMGGKGTPFKIERTFFKFLPVMYSAQLFIWTALELRKKARVEDIESITVFVSAYHLSIDAFDRERWEPKTRETADHSGPYLIGAALVDGEVSEETMTPRRYRDPAILAAVRKITVEEDPAYTAAYPGTLNCRLEARMKSGEIVTAHQSNPKGHPSNPMSDGEIEAKFLKQAMKVLGAREARMALDVLWGVEKIQDVSRIFDALTVIER